MQTCSRAFWMATARFRMPLSRCKSASWPRSAAVSSALGACAQHPDSEPKLAMPSQVCS